MTVLLTYGAIALGGAWIAEAVFVFNRVRRVDAEKTWDR